jgi:hypothetical protein
MIIQSRLRRLHDEDVIHAESDDSLFGKVHFREVPVPFSSCCFQDRVGDRHRFGGGFTLSTSTDRIGSIEMY